MKNQPQPIFDAAVLYGGLNFLQKPSPPFLRKVDRIIENNYSETSFDVNALSRRCCICPMQLHRKMKLETGLSPGKYLLYFRLYKAVHFLLESEQTVSEVSANAGFEYLSSFTRAFTRVFGFAPHILRNRVFAD